MIAKGGYSDQATGPESMGLCVHALTSETWLPCQDMGILSLLPQHAHPDKEEEEQAVGRKCGQAVLWEGKRQMDSAAFWL